MDNRLLNTLPREDRRRLLSCCDRVDLAAGTILYETDHRIDHVYFPTESFISLLTPIDGHPNLEVGLAGNEGMLGATLVLGIGVSPVQALVQGSGAAWRLAAAGLRRELKGSPALRRTLDRYVYVLMNQLALAAACIRFHTVEARLARWLLMTADRAHSGQFDMTHDLLGYMLGVRRVGVTRAAGALRERKLLRYHRGHITILQRRGLEEISCACYCAANRLYEDVLSSLSSKQGSVAAALAARRGLGDQ